MTNKVEIDANGIYYKDLNDLIRSKIHEGARVIDIKNVNGQRYIADGIGADVTLFIDGVPGQDLAAFMENATVIVGNNAQDGVGNTMGGGKVVVKGMAGDVLGYGMRGGKLHVFGDVGYRVGIHMKSYKHRIPVIVVGGSAGDFFGEYMAGGMLILLGLGCNGKIVGDYVGTGMHGGVMYIREKIYKEQLGAEVGIQELTEEDRKILKAHLKEFCIDFNLELDSIMKEKFHKLVPVSSRPYGNLYAY